MSIAAVGYLGFEASGPKWAFYCGALAGFIRDQSIPPNDAEHWGLL